MPLQDRQKRRYFYGLNLDGSRVALISLDDRKDKAAAFALRMYNAVDGKEVAAISLPGVGSEQSVWMSMNADGSRILTVVVSIERRREADDFVTSSQLNVWNVATGKALLTVSLGSVRPGPALSLDGSLAAAIVSLDGKGDIKSPHGVKVWDVATGKEPMLRDQRRTVRPRCV